MQEAVIVDVVRTAVGKGRPGGALSGWHPADLLAQTLRAVVERSNIDPEIIDDVIGGCVSQAGEQANNVTRSAVLAAGLPQHIPAVTVDRQCGSSQQAIHFAAQGIMAGAYDVAIACGVEVMSRVPMFSAAQGKDTSGATVRKRYNDRLVPQGISAEFVASSWSLTREALDAYAAESHRRASAATDSSFLTNEIVPVQVDSGNGRQPTRLTADEGLRPDTSLSTLAGLPAVFRDAAIEERHPEVDWVVTAGNASQLSDGAAAALLMSKERAHQLGLRPRAIVRDFAVVGDDPVLMLTGVIPATQRVCARAGVPLHDIDVFEVNEAFASVVLAWQAETDVDLARVNVHGGAIANGHPLGASGVKLLASLVNVLERTGGRFGLQTMCEAGGMANATIIERV